MKTKILIVMSILGLILLSAFLITNQKTLANFIVDKDDAPIKTYEEYSQIPTKRARLDALNKETPKNKALLWKHHLKYYEQRMQLNEAQKEWLKEMNQFLNEDVFKAVKAVDGDRDKFFKTNIGKSFENLMKKQSNLFSKDQSKIFCTVIGDVSNITQPDPERDNSSNNFDGGVYCNCVTSVCAQCPDLFACESKPCLTVSANCGCFAFWTCTKQCVIDLDGDT